MTSTSDQRVCLTAGTTVAVLTPDEALAATTTRVLRLRAPGLASAVRAILDEPDGPGTANAPGYTASSWNGEDSSPPLSLDERRDWIERLSDAGILDGGPEQARRAVRPVGDPRYVALVDASEPTGRGTEAASDAVTLVLAATVFDADAAASVAELVRAGRPHVVVAVDPGRGAVVSPRWSPHTDVACFDCLRTRLTANSGSGQARAELTRAMAIGANVLSSRPAHEVYGRVAVLLGAERAGDPVEADPTRLERTLWVDPDCVVSRHVALRVPTCPTCRDVDHGSSGAGGLHLEDAVDPLFGIVHAVGVRQAETGPRIFTGGATSADNVVVRPSLRVTVNGGAGFDRAAATSATIGETVERYAAGLYDGRTLRLSSYDDLDDDAVHPERFALYSPEQFGAGQIPSDPFTAATRVRWTRGRRWRDGAALWVPAPVVYLPYRRARGEADIGPQISTGLAAGPDYASAALSGLLEVIERDALALSWLRRVTPRAVPASAVEEAGDVMAALRRRRHWSVDFHDVTLDGTVPTVAAVMRYRHEREDLLAFGSAARPSLAAAVEKAFLEAAQGLGYVRRLLRRHHDWTMRGDFSDVDSFDKHAIVYTKDPELRRRCGYLVDEAWRPDSWRPAPDYPSRPTGASAADLLDEISADLARRGADVVVIDVTTPDVRSLGVSVVRVLVPGFTHLSGIHDRRYLGGSRLADLPGGAATTDFAVPGLNPFPHPLP